MVSDTQRDGASPMMSVEECSDAAEIERIEVRQRRLQRNLDWLHRHANNIYARNRGKCVCIAGEELFVAATAEEAIALANTAHPDDDGRFALYIPLESMPRVYQCL